MGGVAQAETYNLQAASTILIMPDGREVTMWGFSPCTDDTFTSCAPVTVPGPQLVVTDGNLTVNLKNTLPDPVSLVIPGQQTVMTPVWVNPADGVITGTGSRPADVTSRVRSFTHETAAGATGVYNWSGLREGSYLYQSGTHPAKQVQMGLYGAMAYDAGDDGIAYGTSYASEVVLLFSEIDTALHDAVAADEYGPGKAMTSTIDYEADYFLINGVPYFPGTSPLQGNPPLEAGQTVLLRFLNAGLDNRVPIVLGQYLTPLAEDGNPVPFSIPQASLLLPAGKTMDVTITPTSNGYLPIFDRRLGLSNAGAANGGMLAYLQVGTTPTWTLDVVKLGSGSGTVVAASAPGGIDCGGDCSESYLEGTEVGLKAIPAPGSVFAGWSDACLGTGDCSVTMANARTVVATFNAITTIQMVSPNGGEIFPSGSFQEATWAAPANAVTFNLQISLDGGATWKSLAKGLTSTSHTWKVPTPLGNKAKCYLRVQAFNASGAKVGTDRSNGPFTVEVVRIIEPNGAETLSSGMQSIITWQTNATSGLATSATLQYSKDGGVTWKRIERLTGNPGRYAWTVPTVSARKGNCKVKVVLRDVNNVVNGTDVSDKKFAIEPIAAR
jgi:FtsP/CotA-like multicopper oxidase with cupredoxin domain